jgi:hypothetical protein
MYIKTIHYIASFIEHKSDITHLYLYFNQSWSFTSLVCNICKLIWFVCMDLHVQYLHVRLNLFELQRQYLIIHISYIRTISH